MKALLDALQTRKFKQLNVAGVYYKIEDLYIDESSVSIDTPKALTFSFDISEISNVKEISSAGFYFEVGNKFYKITT